MRFHLTAAACAAFTAGQLLAQSSSTLVIVEDGGVSALPHYRSLKVVPDTTRRTVPQVPAHRKGPTSPAGESYVLPVKSMLLKPGVVERRAIRAPGFRPLFLIGDDPRSKLWLRQNNARLRSLNAVGLVVEVATLDALQELRRLAPSLILSAASGDELAGRLNISHYPVLITATTVEQ